MPAATVDHSQRICEVWADNLEEELKRIRHVIRKYNYIAMVSDAWSAQYEQICDMCKEWLSSCRTLSFQGW